MKNLYFPWNNEVHLTSVDASIMAQDARTGVIYPLAMGRPRGLEKRRRKGVYGAPTIVGNHTFDSYAEAIWSVRCSSWLKQVGGELLALQHKFDVPGVCTYTCDLLVRLPTTIEKNSNTQTGVFAIDVKGARRDKRGKVLTTATDASKVRMRAAASHFPNVIFCYGVSIEV
jgi:hypothetical protein